MIKNYIAFISPLVGLNGFCSTSFIYSQVFALVLSTVELFCMAAPWRWIEEQLLGQIRSCWHTCVCIIHKNLRTRARKPQWSIVYLYENSNWPFEKFNSKNRKHPNPWLVLFQAWLSLRPQSEDIRWARTLLSIQKPQDHYSIWT